MKPLHYASIAEIRESVRTKKVSPVEVVAGHLERIETLQPKLNALVHLDGEAARAQAGRAEDAARRGGAVGPLLGVPVTLKSCIDVAGWARPGGPLLGRKFFWGKGAAPAAPRKAAGGSFLGTRKTPGFF